MATDVATDAASNVATGVASNQDVHLESHEGVQLDVRGVCCPLPLIQLAKAVKGLEAGTTVEITGNDPIFESSVRDFCQANGHEIMASKPCDAHGVCILIRIGG